MNHVEYVANKKNATTKNPFLITGNSMHNADLFYATGFLAGDMFSYLKNDGGHENDDGGILLVSKMEEGRAKTESRISDVRTPSDYGIRDKLRIDKTTAYSSVLFELISKEGISQIDVPRNFPVYIADYLRDKGIVVTPVQSPFEDVRRVKNISEIRIIEQVQHACEFAMKQAVGLISQSSVKDGVLYRKNKDKNKNKGEDEDTPLTSEYVRSAIDHVLLDYGCSADDTIVACKSSEPHNLGYGALKADEPIIIDIFPRSKGGRYYSDMTRTVLKGTPSSKVEAMYKDVLDAQVAALSVIKAGVPASDVHNAVCEIFEKRGHPIDGKDGEGFTHSTGHGVGLDIHEAPAVGADGVKLMAGDVITVEPGLYYHDAGGVRLEDIVVVTEAGCRNLTMFEKRLVVDI